MRILFFSLPLLALSSCLSSFFADDPPKDAAVRYEPPKPDGWRLEDAGEADVLYRKVGGQASISLNSVCDQYQNRSLEDLIEELSARLPEKEEVERRKMRVQGMPALRVGVKGVIDQNPVTVVFTVARSRSCVYDFILASSPEVAADELSQYEKLIESFATTPEM